MPKCFVSFSSCDDEFAGKLIASLRLQNADVWDYSNSAQDIPLGEGIKANLRARIDESGRFIAVLTPASTHPETGRFTIFEIRYAQEKGMRIFPVALELFSLRSLPPELAFLEDAKYLPFASLEGDAYERSFARLCEEMGLAYIPPFLGDPRVIFAPRFEAEIRGLSIPNEHRVLLRMTIDDFTHQYAAGKWSEAEETIGFFIGACKRFLKGTVLYYPALLLALCRMHKNDLDGAQTLIEDLLDHPLVDENAWGALGQVYFVRGDLLKALDAFKTAREKCPPGQDWVSRFNILAVSVELALPAEVSAAFSGFDLASRPLDDQVKIANLQASVYSRHNDWRAVVNVLRNICDRQIGNATTAIYLAQAYERLGCYRDAVTVLAGEAGRLDDENLYHHLAALYGRGGDTVSALRIYEQHLSEDTTRPQQMLTDYAILLLSLGRRTEARNVCRRAIALEPVKAGAERYFRGLAYYLLGRLGDAQTSYQESKSSEPYYDTFAERLAGMATYG
jgi:tetratricopeptide (TPR) repeat protein